MEEVHIGSTLAAPLLQDEMRPFQLAHIFARHIFAGVQISTQPPIARKAALLLQYLLTFWSQMLAGATRSTRLL